MPFNFEGTDVGDGAVLAGERSGLFHQAVRLIKEMRKASSGRYPRFAVWENVPGAFSSNKGAGFHQVLRELIIWEATSEGLEEVTE